jgi:hypothetical protein
LNFKIFHIFEGMSLKVILWIVIGIIYLISRARKRSQPQPPTPDSRPAEPEVFDKPLTFDELLKEIQAAKQPKPQPLPAKPDYVDYDEEIEEDAKPFERVDYRKEDKIYETYEKAKEEAFHRPTMEETLKLENTIVRFGQFKSYVQDDKPSLASVYAKDLREPENFRKAFILSEILNRRF